MASALDKQTQQANENDLTVVVEEHAYEQARRDPRLSAFFADAEEFVGELDRSGRNV